METQIKQPHTQKGQQVINLDEDGARAYFENLRWPNGPACIHCGSVNVYRLGGKAARPGVLECRDCRKQFTVTLGTIMEASHLPLATWAKAFHLMCSSKKGISALQLQRNLGIGSYRTAWFLAHRIREAMKCEPVAGLLKGAVQVDEAYIGGKPRKSLTGPVNKGGGDTKKTPVVALVETGGRVRCEPIKSATTQTLKAIISEKVDPSATIVTDELRAYRGAVKGFAGHETVNHSILEYVNDDGFTTNTAESFFALLKRGVHGTFHHVSKQHLHRYCNEFAFRWDGRKLSDNVRRDEAVRGSEGKRLAYKSPKQPKPC